MGGEWSGMKRGGKERCDRHLEEPAGIVTLGCGQSSHKVFVSWVSLQSLRLVTPFSRPDSSVYCSCLLPLSMPSLSSGALREGLAFFL